ncbi:MAG: DUF1648 domain-containing protein [Eubacteriales bacterium]|nr:DUF1648 domain-containing protein [Eubacteriales bacterium]
MDEPIKIERNVLDIIEAVVSLCCLVGVTLYLILAWNTIPAQIPAHYNAAGEVNRWGNKSELIVLPIISVMLYGMITLIERFPQIWNTGIRVTEENRTQVYRLLKNLIACVKIIMLSVFSFLTVLSALARNLSIWFLLAFVALLFGTIAYFIVKLTRLRSKYPLE